MNSVYKQQTCDNFIRPILESSSPQNMGGQVCVGSCREAARHHFDHGHHHGTEGNLGEAQLLCKTSHRHLVLTEYVGVL